MKAADPAADRPPRSQYLSFGIGAWANQIFDNGIGTLAFYVFNIGLGVDPFLVGLAQSLARGVDLFTDPFAGYVTDSFRSRFSLRRFIALGSIVGGVSFALVWRFPLGLSPTAYFVWLLVCFSICSAAWSIFSVPRYALGFEMTSLPHERNQLMTFQALMATGLNLLLAWSYRFIQRPVFGNVLNGARWAGSAMGVAIVIFGLLSVAWAKERPAPARAADTSPGVGDFFRSTKRVGQSRPFRLLAGSVAFALAGVIGTFAVAPYLLIYYVCGGDQARGAAMVAYASTAWIVTGIVLAPLVLALSRRIGKRNTLFGFLGLAFFSCSLRWLCYNPALPWLVLLSYGCFGAGIGGLAAMAPSMTADVCDYEHLATGRREAGMFSAFYSWTLKFGMTIGYAITGLLMDLTGFHAVKGAHPTAAMVTRMRILDSAYPAVMLALALIMLRRYPITTERMAEVRTALEVGVPEPI